ADTAAALEQSLATVDECAQALNAIQRRWVYLEPVFGRGALPSEGPELSGAPPLDGTLALLRQSAAAVVVASIFTVVCWWAFWLV
ncbi:MAG: hypothetical protein EBR23_10355, partial [Planctomycetia bacterium]|nr:hypothetical protein [Planctomycetia bacterium]